MEERVILTHKPNFFTTNIQIKRVFNVNIESDTINFDDYIAYCEKNDLNDWKYVWKNWKNDGIKFEDSLLP